MYDFETATTTRALALPKLRAYWTLLKSAQTGLLLVTGLAGYISGHPHTATWLDILALLGSLFLAVGGSTVLNMVIDRDIDAQMQRTARRPLPSGMVGAEEGTLIGLGMAFLGVLWAMHIAFLFGVLIFAGLFFDVVIYTWWLKRRTPWSILWGGLAGGMPVLAGRALATGRVDVTGVLLALAVLLWIPTHILTFSIKYAGDYAHAGVPVFPNRYGTRVTRWIIAVSTCAAVVVMLWAVYRIGVAPALLWIARGLGGILVGFTLVSTIHNAPKLNYILFKLASLYMLGSMLLLIAGA
ncbi:MAG: UbiA family prenyltransferase [Anaerolineae bacterium]|nr:UbiA family prenyltransferase [Anaerolineae bacterium]